MPRSARHTPPSGEPFCGARPASWPRGATLSNEEVSICGVYCTKSELFLKAILMKVNRTRGARGDSKLNRTLHESPATASLHSATPKRKNVPCSVDFRGGGFFLFGVLPVKIFEQCGGASIRTRFCENYFLGIWIFAKPRLICFWILSARRRGLGRNPRGLLFGFLRNINKISPKDNLATFQNLVLSRLVNYYRQRLFF